MALTDHGNVYAAIDFYKAAKSVDIKPIIGMEGYVAFGSRHERTAAEGASGGSQPHITLLAENSDRLPQSAPTRHKGPFGGVLLSPAS